jgi:competence protein ComEC
VIFQKPIYNCLFIKNKWLDKVWKLVAVSSAAQLLTFPVCIYYFHQFPNLFLITNIIAVPLSGFILYAEIALVAFSWIPFVGSYTGKLVNWLVWIMNKIILWMNDLSFAVWDKIPATVLSTWLLYAVVIGFSMWLIQKNKKYFLAGLISLFVFVVQSIYNKWVISNQQKIIVYNVPQHRAIDFIKGSNYQFVGDSILLEDGMLQNFHLKPARIALQLKNPVHSLAVNLNDNLFYQFNDKKIINIQFPIIAEAPAVKPTIDLIIISKNPKLSIAQLAKVFNCKQFVFDASNAYWQIDKWQKECRALHLNYFTIPTLGSFIYNIGI